MPSNAGITVKKAADNSFTVHFPVPVQGPGTHKAGEEVPVEWLRAALDYYIQHRETDGSLPASAHAKVKALW